MGFGLHGFGCVLIGLKDDVGLVGLVWWVWFGGFGTMCAHWAR